MSRILGRVVLVIVPVLFVIFMIRIGYLGYSGGSYELVWDSSHTYVEEIVINRGNGFLFWDDLYAWFNSFPDFGSYIQTTVDEALTKWTYMVAVDVVDWNSFWESVGLFFQGVAGFFALIWNIIRWPVDVIIWIVRVFFTPASV